MQKIILISGLIGAGKTSVANKLLNTIEDVALIQADKMVDFEPFIIGDKLTRIKFNNCSALIDNYLSENFKNIICEGFIQNQFELNNLETKYKGYSIYLFWLELDRATREDRVKNREQGTDDEPAFMDAQETSNTEPWPFSSNSTTLHEIKVKDKTVQEITTEIVKIITSQN